MSTISGLGGVNRAWDTSQSGAARKAEHEARLFAKVDSDGSGSVDATELATLLEHAGQSGDSAELLKKMDSRGDGSLSSDELQVLATSGAFKLLGSIEELAPDLEDGELEDAAGPLDDAGLHEALGGPEREAQFRRLVGALEVVLQHPQGDPAAQGRHIRREHRCVDG